MVRRAALAHSSTSKRTSKWVTIGCFSTKGGYSIKINFCFMTPRSRIAMKDPGWNRIGTIACTSSSNSNSTKEKEEVLYYTLVNC